MLTPVFSYFAQAQEAYGGKVTVSPTMGPSRGARRDQPPKRVRARPPPGKRPSEKGKEWDTRPPIREGGRGGGGTTKGPLGLGQMATDEYDNARCTYRCVHYALPLPVRRQTRRRMRRLIFQPMVTTRRLEPKSLEPKPKPGTNTGNLQRWVLWCQ